jgi:hypothetical protein
MIAAAFAISAATQVAAQAGPYGAFVRETPEPPEVETVGSIYRPARYCDAPRYRHRRLCAPEPRLRRNYYFPAYYWNGAVYPGWAYPYYGYPNCGYPFEKSCW